MSSSRGSSQPRDRTQVSPIAGGFFTICATKEAQLVGKIFKSPMQSGNQIRKKVILNNPINGQDFFYIIIFSYLISRLHGTFKDLSHDTRAPLVAQTVKNPPAIQDFDPWVRKILWRRKWLPIPVFLPGEFYRQRRLVGYSPWGCKELDTTEVT